MKKSLTTLALGFLAGSLALAQAPAAPTDRLVLSGGLVFAQGNALDMTHKASGGYSAEAGYQFSPKDYGVDFLIYAGWKKLPAAEPSPERPTFDLAGPHFGFDLIYKPWESLPITLSTGPSIHVWQVEQQGVADGRKGDQGLKLGWRAGVDYTLNRAWSIGLKYTLTEWRSTPNLDDPTLSVGPSRPADMSLMASYRF